jgi:hypothetical protein
MSLLKKLFGKKTEAAGRRRSAHASEDSESEAAEDLLRFLELRLVLNKPITEKCPRGVVRSIRKTRGELRRLLQHWAAETTLHQLAAEMRAATREFLAATCQNQPHAQTCDDCTVSTQGCARELLQFRQKMGALIDQLCQDFNLVPDEGLRPILPTADGQPGPGGISAILLDHDSG